MEHADDIFRMAVINEKRGNGKAEGAKDALIQAYQASIVRDDFSEGGYEAYQAARADAREKALVKAKEIRSEYSEEKSKRQLDVELANLTENYPYDPEELRAAACEAGVELCSWATSANFAADISAQETALRAEIDRAAAMGCKAVRTDIYHEDVPHPYAENVLAALRRLADYAQEKDVVLITENHGGYLVTPERLERLFQAVDHENFGLLCDFANFADANEDPARAVRLLKKHIRHVHVKDCHLLPGDRLYPGEGWYVTAGGDYWRCAIAGQGNLPLAQCMKTLLQSGYDGYLTAELSAMPKTPEYLYESTVKALDTILAM